VSRGGLVVALSGGVGGAKLALGLSRVLPAEELMVVANTGDDFEHLGLSISPDLDTLTYALAGLDNPETGWGRRDETWSFMAAIGELGGETWFRLGDRDLATHLLRTELLRDGRTLTEVTADLSSALDIQNHILPMCDEPVQTIIQTPEGYLDFQEYFVRHRHADTVTGVLLKGIAFAHPTAQVTSALSTADAIIFCPSNPIVSIGPILAIPGLLDALMTSPAPRVAVSPIVGGAALKGPAADMLRSLGHEVSPTGVARIYGDAIHGMIIDRLDEAHAPRIEALGIAVEIADTIMKTDQDRYDLANIALRFCRELDDR
jgi:LPPG:FO 2-phospho-L-lactate transferase